ncbi:DUF4282 domain-containing protein [Azospirillum sp. CT11-132]|uniref:DUF4282 domain-containing protein n=1 Tax=unclassified Azospirillum TaxID=2630922 RepID=UPI000D60FB2B|nr:MULTISPECIES: DUF4282 domain-containing protein [unclassified Azospirillum]PWC63065.1 hypothetical protein TSH7_14025 [Azospirillum sp. TSH7]PWC72707.1 hypothetical protein TSH20_00520 [Azospirillum sp. TSH20]
MIKIFSSLLSFDRMIAIPVIKVLYWIGLIGGAVGGVVSAIGGLGMMRWDAAAGVGTFIVTLAGTAFGLLMWRVACEGMIVVFGIHERLGHVKDALSRQASA